MGGPQFYNVDENIDYYSNIASDYNIEEYSSTKDTFQGLENHNILFKYLKYLSSIDATFVILSYMYRMSQENISKFLDISQVGVSVKIRRALEKIKFVLTFPKLDYIEVRTDLLQIFGKSELFYVAYFFYWNHTQSRTRHFLNITQCGSASKLKEVLSYLENILENSGDDDLVFLSRVYLDFFNAISEKSNILNMFFRNDFEKNSRLTEATPVF